MNLRNKILAYFLSLIIVVLLVFGFSAYQLSYDNAIESDKIELARLVKSKSQFIYLDYKKNNSFNHAIQHVLDLPDENYVWVLFDNHGSVIFPKKITPLFSTKINLSMLKNSTEQNGVISDGENKYLWASATVKETQHTLFCIFKPYDSGYYQRFSKLASRLVITGLIITFIAAWFSLMFSSSMKSQIKYHKNLGDKLHIANQKLIEAKDLSEKSNKSKSEFLSNMSHEIRTPLTSIIGFAESNLDINQSSKERIKATKTIIKNGKHLMEIVNEILDLSKVEAGKLDIEKRPFSITSMLADIEQLVLVMVEGKDLVFKINYVYPLPKIINSDQLRLKQILLNLCSNAIKFTSVGSVELIVSYHEESSNLIFIVVDTGIGLTKEQQIRIFKPYEQAKSSTTHKYNGTGLGLTLSTHLIGLLKGEITVESEVDQGSRFTAKIEIDKVANNDFIYESDETEVTDDIEKNTLGSLQGKVLVAEDDPDIQDLVDILFRRVSIQPDFVNNGQLALDQIATENYDLVFMDIEMPLMDGLSTMSILQEKNYSVPMVAMTANAMQKDRDKCKEVGFLDFVTKPIDRSHFYSVLKQYLKPALKAEQDDTVITSNLLIDEPSMIVLIDKFLLRLPILQNEINLAYKNGKEEELSGIIHQMKGVGGGYGYPMMSELCAKIEFHITANDRANIATLIEEFNLMATKIIQGREENHKIAEQADA